MQEKPFDQQKYFKDWLKFLDENEIRFQLITASLYVTAYDLLIDTIIRKIEEFYIDGFDEDGFIISKRYTTEVRGLFKKDIVIASSMWLLNNKVITEAEIEKIKIFKTHRNELAHELSKMITDSDANTKTDFIKEIRDIYFKIHKWWFIEFEVQINPDLSYLDTNKLNYDEVLMLQLLPMDYMLNIVNDEIKKRSFRKIKIQNDNKM
ncbi:hypothetical protein Aeqsu_1003 [Aequorivita sublithincola DSM 14238]|uniref:Uncharacterized protein n=1 Tax=Aequorivita sublithincola (strain DSM 14238 / LMG 21431 / ACAM 643 / 9-3) TaxID=746697 RepID=I3YU36_AEQSU|nr:hypothetical protein [Aequorivita sublithincola]AFL80504.1 hypothetical protein Aeqsu_1003 [Aequorivita sublithincola DSM 14238]